MRISIFLMMTFNFVFLLISLNFSMKYCVIAYKLQSNFGNIFGQKIQHWESSQHLTEAQLLATKKMRVVCTSLNFGVHHRVTR